MYESGNALRGIFLTAFVALLLFSSFIFCFHLERPDAMTVEPEMTGYYFYHPDIAVFHPSENNAALRRRIRRQLAQLLVQRLQIRWLLVRRLQVRRMQVQVNGGLISLPLGCSCHPVSVLPVSVLQNTKAICDFIIIRKEDSI